MEINEKKLDEAIKSKLFYIYYKKVCFYDRDI